MFKAVLWDFGGVFISSPFDAFAEFERRNGLPAGFLRSVNATDPDVNAWARLERNELTAHEFDEAFASESRVRGYEVAGADVLALLAGELRPRMVAALDAVRRAGFATACLTNNVAGGEWGDGITEVLAKFDVIIESSKAGVRKPERRFYELACEMLAVEPESCVFLDDLGINLKPARGLGMATIKVDDPDVALTELAALLGLDLDLRVDLGSSRTSRRAAR